MESDSATLPVLKNNFTGGVFPVLIAHRGAMTAAPENTLAAFDTALLQKAEGIEFDVRLTADEIPVVFHDDSLFRITGRNGSISDYTFDDLKALDFGKWFSPAYAKTPVLSLKEVLRMYGGKTILMIELKTGPPAAKNFEKSRHRLAEKCVGLIMKLIPENRISNMIYILSFDYEVLLTASKTAPGIKRILNIDTRGDKQMDNADPYGIVWGFGLPLAELHRSVLHYINDAGKKVLTYSCNTEQEIAAALKSKADFVLTDDPAKVVQYFFNYRKNHKERSGKTRENCKK